MLDLIFSGNFRHVKNPDTLCKYLLPANSLPGKLLNIRKRRDLPPLKLFKHKRKSEPFACNKYPVRIILTWCDRQELNLHGVSHKILSLARLPVPPRSHLYYNELHYILNRFICQPFFVCFL